MKASAKIERHIVPFHKIRLGAGFIHNGQICQKINETLPGGKNQYAGSNTLNHNTSAVKDLTHNEEVRCRIENIKEKYKTDYVKTS